MYQACINLILASILLPAVCLGQFGGLNEERSFLQHLQRQKLYDERLFVLNNLSDLSNTREISLEKAWTYHALGSYDSALFTYRTIPCDTIFKYRFHYNYLSLLFKHEEISQLQEFVPRHLPDKLQRKLRTSLDLLLLEYDLSKGSKEELPESIVKQYHNYQRIERKSVFLATTYSIILPGSGKFYYGNKRQAWNTFFANFALGIQTYESYRKAGVSSARFIIFGSLFSVFYLSNIYGTIAGLKKAKRDHYKQLHYEITSSFFRDRHVHPVEQ